MKRSPLAGLAILCALLCSDTQALADASPSAADRTAYAQGQSYGRTFQDYLQPGICGIVLERQRCRDDFAAVQQVAGPRDMDAQVASWLQNGDLDKKITSWDGVMIPDVEWQKNPSFGWWWTAGVLSEAVGLPRTTGVESYVSTIVDLLAKHADASPTQFKGLIGSSGSSADRAKPLIDALNVAVPPTEFPSLTIGDGDAGDAQLGVLDNTILELIDSPFGLSRPESRLFALDFVNHVEAIDRKLGGSTSFDDMRRCLRGDIPTDHDLLITRLQKPLTEWVSQLKQSPLQRDAYLFGGAVAQSAYNAAVLKDIDSDRDFRGFISQTKPYDGMLPSAIAAVAKMQNVGFGDWPNVNATASAATLAIMGQ
ncbi:MAG TPA: hypothetical protein VKT51_02555 [Candidatus Eremiobacteraceae bacterium]|nr:hypothetical protein [Candidatus Eremiobacteraceae bacterium]